MHDTVGIIYQFPKMALTILMMMKLQLYQRLKNDNENDILINQYNGGYKGGTETATEKDFL